MPTSEEWRLYFKENAHSLLDIPWHLGGDLKQSEADTIRKSLREFQAGETSEGKHLLRYSQEYADRTGDHQYVAAMRLFILEEQRHARDLGRFLTVNGISLVRTTFTDVVFRRLRNLVGTLEISIAVLITAEIIAKVYYAVLRNATSSVVLRRICDQILRDEQRHVQFQAEQLAKLRAGRRPAGKVVVLSLQRFLYFGTVPVVWFFHREVIRRGGLPFGAWWAACWREYRGAFIEPLPDKVLEPVALLGSEDASTKN